MRTTPRTLLAVTALALLAAACGDDGGGGPDGEAMAEAFGEASAEAYDAMEVDRDEYYSRGISIDEGCLLIDDDLAERVLGAAFEGSDAEDDEQLDFGMGLVQGIPGESEVASCSLSQGERRMAVMIGTTLRDIEQQEAAARRGAMAEADRVDVDVDGLPSDEVFVLADEEQGIVNATWIDDGFAVSLNAPLGDAEPEQVARALGVVVEGVADQLDG